MPNPQIKEIILSLSFSKKLLGAGLILMLISLFLPWYQDLDSFKTGDMFLGITGPLYMAGVTLFLLIGANIALMISEIQGTKPSFVKTKTSNIYLATGIFSFYILMLVNSVFFHDKFGLNVSVKQSDFGMFFAFIGASLTTIGAYLNSRDRVAAVHEFKKDTAEDVVKMPVPKLINEQTKPAGNLRTMASATVNEQPKPVAKMEQPVATKVPSQSTAFANLQMQLKKNLEIKPGMPQHLPNVPPPKSHVSDFIKAEEPAGKAPQPYRMDL